MDADQMRERAIDNCTKAQVRMYVCTPVPSWPKFWYVLVRLDREEVFRRNGILRWGYTYGFIQSRVVLTFIMSEGRGMGSCQGTGPGVCT